MNAGAKSGNHGQEGQVIFTFTVGEHILDETRATVSSLSPANGGWSTWAMVASGRLHSHTKGPVHYRRDCPLKEPS